MAKLEFLNSVSRIIGLLKVEQKNRILINSFATILAVCASGFCVFARIGFVSDFLQLFTFLGFSLLIINGNELLRIVGREKFFLSAIFLSALLVLILVACFIYSSAILLFISSLGFFAAIITLFKLFRSVSFLWSILTLSGFAVFSFWLVLGTYGTGYITPTFIEDLAYGKTNTDLLYHTSIAQLINTYGYPSIGLDGPVRNNYHIGSHVLVKNLALFFRADVYKIYNYLVPVLFFPLYFKLFFHAVNSISVAFFNASFSLNPTDRAGRISWLAFVVLTVGLLPGSYLAELMISLNYLVSFSYLLGLVLFFFVVVLICGLKLSFDQSARNAFSAFNSLIIAVLCLCGFIKISFPFVVLPVLFYMNFRLQVLKRPVILATWALAAAIIYWQLTSMGEAAQAPTYFLDFLLKYTPPGIRIIYYPIYFIAVVTVCFYIYLERRISPTASFLSHGKTPALLLVEVLILGTLISILPGFFLAIGGGSAGYFSDILRKFGAICLMAALPGMVHRVSSLTAHLSLVFNSISFIVILHIGFIAATDSFANLKKTLSTKIELRGLGLYSGYIGLDKEIGQWPRYKFLKRLEALNHLSVEEKSNSMIYIPQTDTTYFRAWSKPYVWNTVMIVPAVSGISLVDGFIPSDLLKKGILVEFFGKGYYGLRKYKKRDSANSKNASDTEVCNLVNKTGFKQQHVFIGTVEDTQEFRKISCVK